jgi:CRISPR-associated endonuclease Cas1
MAATRTLSHPQFACNSQGHSQSISASKIVPRYGAITLSGYGIDVRVDRGHLLLQDGIGDERFTTRLPRVGHGLKRLVVIGADGEVSLAALRWIADQNAAFVMLDRDGSVLMTTGPVRSSDARLRRAQALAHHSGTALRISRELISQKLSGQELVAREQLQDSTTADAIAKHNERLATAESVDALRLIEPRAAGSYWAAWRNVPVAFPKKDLLLVAEHWRKFGARISPLTGSPRLAANPVNAILNYLYALLESEASLAVAVLGLDPGLGVMHVDTPSRDSLASDLMEPIRPQVDAFVLDWILREPLKRGWFFEQRNGNCRLMADFASRLSETTKTWASAVAPYAEWIARILWTGAGASIHQRPPATRLTHRRKRESRGSDPRPDKQRLSRPQSICRACGCDIPPKRNYCRSCSMELAKENMLDIARSGRAAAHTPQARDKVSKARRRNAIAEKNWNPSMKPVWLTEEIFATQVRPKLKDIPCSAIAKATSLSEVYAADIRAGRHLPHPRHWQALSSLVGVSRLQFGPAINESE